MHLKLSGTKPTNREHHRPPPKMGFFGNAVKLFYDFKNMVSLKCCKKQVIFLRKNRKIVYPPLTCYFDQRYYNAGLIFGHL